MKDFIFINMFMKLGEKFLGASSPRAYTTMRPALDFPLYDLFLIFLNKNKYNLFTNLAHHLITGRAQLQSCKRETKLATLT